MLPSACMKLFLLLLLPLTHMRSLPTSVQYEVAWFGGLGIDHRQEGHSFSWGPQTSDNGTGLLYPIQRSGMKILKN